MTKKERGLTPAEQKRKADFEKICEEMEQSGYLKKNLTIGVLKANLLAIIIMLPFAAVFLCLFFIDAPVGDWEDSLSIFSYVMFLIGWLLLIVLHEVIHGVAWGFFAKGHWRSISLGVIWKMLTPYCTCADPLTKRQYMIGVAMPTLIVGFVPAVVAISKGTLWLFVLAEIIIFCGV